jgi:hypothetical protein
VPETVTPPGRHTVRADQLTPGQWIVDKVIHRTKPVLVRYVDDAVRDGEVFVVYKFGRTLDNVSLPGGNLVEVATPAEIKAVESENRRAGLAYQLREFANVLQDTALPTRGWATISLDNALTPDELVQVGEALGIELSTPYPGRREVVWGAANYDGLSVTWSAAWPNDAKPAAAEAEPPEVGPELDHAFAGRGKTCDKSVGQDSAGFIRCGLTAEDHPQVKA